MRLFTAWRVEDTIFFVHVLCGSSAIDDESHDARERKSERERAVAPLLCVSAWRATAICHPPLHGFARP